MEKHFNYKDVPTNYLHCLNASCTRSVDCLRYQVALRVDADTSSYHLINPKYITARKDCQYFRSDCMIRFALGMKHLFDNLPHAKAIRIRSILLSHFERNMYYRFLNKKRLIRQEDQAFIRDVFRSEGIEEEPVFDEYIEQYDW